MSYNVALVCERGHLVSAEVNLMPHRREGFCAECGAKTLDRCRGCQATIRGSETLPTGRVFGETTYETHISGPPRVCHACGAPFPWATVEADEWPEQRAVGHGAWTQYRPGEKADLVPLARRDALSADLPIALGEATADAPLALILCDLDHFKRVNDEHGHDVGDEVIVGMATILAAVSKGRGKAYRYGGEELALLLPNTTDAEAEAVAERMRTAMGQRDFSVSGLRVTVSVGVVAGDGMSSTPDGLIKEADRALYAAKHSGRNQVRMARTAGVHAAPPEDSVDLELRVQPNAGFEAQKGHLQHVLIASVVNRSSETIAAYRVEFELPAEVIDEPSSLALRVLERCTATVVFVRTTELQRRPPEIYPGDPAEVFRLHYCESGTASPQVARATLWLDGGRRIVRLIDLELRPVGSSPPGACPICRRAAERSPTEVRATRITCARCGVFTVTPEAEAAMAILPAVRLFPLKERIQTAATGGEPLFVRTSDLQHL